MKALRRPAQAISLRWRLLLATAVALAVALALALWALSGLFRDHVTQRFEADLLRQLDELTARLVLSADGRPSIDPATLSDPRWRKPYSGLYWQIDAPGQPAVLRSRSLWDATLVLPADALDDGQVHRHSGVGPQGEPLRMIERTVRPGPVGAGAAAVWRLVVAADDRPTDAAVRDFTGALAASLGVLLLLLLLAALAQVRIGLAPLRSLSTALARLREGQATRLEGDFPEELGPLIADFNQVLARNAEVVARARTQAGNLAHAVKTPLAVLRQAAARPAAGAEALAQLVEQQVGLAHRQVDWHLARSRAAASVGLPGLATQVGPVAEGLVRVMQRLHAGRAESGPGLTIEWHPPQAPVRFAGEEQDLQEMLGNLLDNACKWARARVRLSALVDGDGRLLLRVEDDGPGLAESQHEAVWRRGVRADESVPGTGLGLAIVADLVALYGGEVRLSRSEWGGLCAEISLPLAAG